MNKHYLLKINHKQEIIKLLNIYQTNLKVSSIYRIEEQRYVLIISDIEITLLNNKVIKNYNPIENLLYQWALAEILQTIDYINFENNSFYVKNGRLIKYLEADIVRTREIFTQIFAILNYNENSFSDGGLYYNIDSLLNHAVKQIEAGADILDLGIASTNINSKLLPSDVEINILQQVLPKLVELKLQYKVALSIDTYNQETIKWLLGKNIDFINDVSGSIPLDLLGNIIKNDIYYIAMHNLSIPANKNLYIPLEKNPIDEIILWINRLKDCYKNIDLNKLIFDPGIGFGKIATQSCYIIRNINQLILTDINLLVGHSRKSFLTHMIGCDILPSDRDTGTAIASSNLVNKVNYLRLHNVEKFFYWHNIYKNL
jgi:dihydropteroate synthase